MRPSLQLKFADPRLKKMHSYGGTFRSKAKNRGARPLSTKDPIHLVLRSSKAISTQSFRHPSKQKRVHQMIQSHCRKYGIKLHQFANAGNHLHLLLKIPKRHVYLRFIRSLTGSLALAQTGSNKLSKLKERFWDFRPFTRVVVSRRGYQITRDYVILNQLEALKIIPYQKQRLKSLEPPWLTYFEFT
jgi:putative transposase